MRTIEAHQTEPGQKIQLFSEEPRKVIQVDNWTHFGTPTTTITFAGGATWRLKQSKKLTVCEETT